MNFTCCEVPRCLAVQILSFKNANAVLPDRENVFSA